MLNIKWYGLYDKNSDKLCAAIHAQLVLESTYEQRHNEKMKDSCQSLGSYKMVQGM